LITIEGKADVAPASFFLLLGFVALYVAWVCFAWFYFLLEPFFLQHKKMGVVRATERKLYLTPENWPGGNIWLLLEQAPEETWVYDSGFLYTPSRPRGGGAMF